METSKHKNILLGGIIIFSLFLLSGCNAALLNPKGMIGIQEKDLIITSLLLMLIVVVPVILMIFHFAYKYRSSNTEAEYLPEWSHSTKIEAVVWIIPIIIIAILGTITWKSTHELDPYKPLVSKQKPITIEVVSLDWKWLFIYPDQHIATINYVAFPKNVPVNFKVTSDTVMNSFFIPQLGGQIYAMAGMMTQLHLIANQTGDYDGISSSYSGAGFSDMKFKAVVLDDRSQFNHWVHKIQVSAPPLRDMSAFKTIAEPSKQAPVSYYSHVPSQLFASIINQFMGSLNDDKKMNMSKTATSESQTVDTASLMTEQLSSPSPTKTQPSVTQMAQRK